MNNKYILDKTSVHNIENVRRMIDRKVSIIGEHSFYVQENEIKGVRTDVDHLPYTRLYRSNPFTGEAIPWSGDSGFQPRMNSFYEPNIVQTVDESEPLCFQTPCSTVYPCHPQYLQKNSDKAYNNLQDRYCTRRYV